MLNGIDISAYQAGINISALTTTDFVIVKATEGTSYKNPYFVQHIEAAIQAGKKVGAYHYASGKGAKAEADFFLSVVKPYLGKLLLCFDWESYTNSAWGNISYAKQWLDYVRGKTGIVPVLYTSESVAAKGGWSDVAKTYPLWGAQYANYKTMDYTQSPWSSGGWGPWGAKPTIHQYTSSGVIKGYSAKLDLNLFYGSRQDWDKLCGGTGEKTETTAAKPKLVSYSPWKLYHNGSSVEPVYSNTHMTEQIGALYPSDSCYCDGRYGDAYHIYYLKTGTTDDWKTGYVKYNGGITE